MTTGDISDTIGTMDLLRILFVITATITTFAFSILTANIYAVGLNVSDHTAKVLFIIALIFPIVFVVSMLTGRKSESKIPFIEKFNYFLSSITGVAFYLFLSSVFLGIIIFVMNIFGINSLELLKNISCITLIIGVLMSIGALIQARFIKITKYEISLKNVPTSWNGKTAVLVSDTHFGIINHKKFSDKIVKKILEINPDFVLHSGDFYDGPYNNTAIITESWKNLTAKIPVFYAPGNHEEYGPYTEFINSIKNAGITVLQDNSIVYDGVQIAGITYRANKQRELVGKVLETMNLDKIMPTILINHPPTFQKEAQSVGVDLMVSGHTHRGQFWPNNFITMMIYGKYYYGSKNYEDMSAITTSGVGTAGPAMRLWNTPEMVLITFTTKLV
jgi:uncharacterized protein